MRTNETLSRSQVYVLPSRLHLRIICLAVHAVENVRERNSFSVRAGGFWHERGGDASPERRAIRYILPRPHGSQRRTPTRLYLGLRRAAGCASDTHGKLTCRRYNVHTTLPLLKC